MTDKGTILVVDDSQAALRLMTKTLAEAGYGVRPADSGNLALASVAASPPELILLDIRMPSMDGFEVFRRLAAREESRAIPVLFLSASTEIAERVQCLKLGAVDFIPKDGHPEELLARVATHLELSRLRVRLERNSADLRATNEQLQVEIAARERAQAELADKIVELEGALAKVKQLEGVIPICMYCKRIRDDKESWQQLERYITEHSEAMFSHSICPECVAKRPWTSRG